MNEIEYDVRSVSYPDRPHLANLIHFGAYVHQHLDWKSPLDWIGKTPYLLVQKKGILSAALACPPELPGITWIRLFAVSSNITLRKAWEILWGIAVDEIIRNGKMQVAALSLQGWFNELLEANQFEHTDNVIILMWDSSTSIPNPGFTNVIIRPMLPEDIPAVVDIDHNAFSMEWRNSRDSLELAFHQSDLTTVAEYGEEIVGYQCSTSSSMGGHLARLAVKTNFQGKGIGYLLVYELLHRYKQRGITHVTVNTQQSNFASLALYAKAGFNQTGESYRVYQYTIND